ncbi:MAG: hypothetical protein U9Q39_06465 [Pseudomonadota bacterium]|nr:hypothetical protein [Pseudomonadota bacterium]
METQTENFGISQFSRMNAFYGIPNVSQETSAAIDGGARAPEVYTTPEPPELPEPRAAEAGSNPENQVESFFSQTTEQLEISDQAVAMQQSEEGALAAQAAQTYGAIEESTTSETQPPAREGEVGAQLQTEEPPPDMRQEIDLNPEPNRPTPAVNSEPAATSFLNEGAAPEPQTPEANANNPLQQSYGQFPGGPAAGNADQAGAIFSALG